MMVWAQVGAACVVMAVVAGVQGNASAATWDPDAADYSGHKGVTLYVSKLGNDTDGSSWATAYRTIQAALDAVPDANGGHRVIVRPDTYMEANLSVKHSGAAGAYNVLVGDTDGRYGSGTAGRIVIDSGDPEKGFKSYDWWSTIRATSQGWSPEHKDPTYSAIVWDRWVLRGLYATGADAGLFWDCTNRIEPFTIVVEDCVSIGRAFGGGVASCLSRPDEPITFRRCKLWSLDMWGDTTGAYIRVENQAMPERPDVVLEDCTMVGPQCALKGGNYGFHTFMRIRADRCKLVALNFSQPAGTPTDGIVQSVEEGQYLHVDFTDCTLMGYKVFGVKVKKDTVDEIGYTAKGATNAYVQFTQDVPKGMLRLGHWPTEMLDALVPPPTPTAPARPTLGDERIVRKDMCEVSPVVWKGRHCLLACVRPGAGGTKEDYSLTVRDAEAGQEMARFGTGHSLGCAFVKDDTFYAFAARFENDNWNDVTMFRSQDLQHWDQKVIVKQEGTEHLFNSSVCAGPDGCVLAYESNDPKYPGFTVKFARTKDMETWTPEPEAVFGTDRYTACPTIRYVDGFYYLLYLEHRTPRWFFETYIARSADLRKWFQSPLNPVLTPKAVDDSVNASDPDLVEFEGKTHLYYAVGDQRTWMNVKRVTYPGPLAAFLKGWFPTDGIPEAGDLDGYRARMEADAKTKRIAWFNDAKFGLFIHWGPFAVQGNDQNAAYDYFDMKENATLRSDYVRYATAFSPKVFDAAKWMEIAKGAGTKYVVFTSKHHDGYSLFDSALTDYDSADAAPKRDYVAELAKAAKAADLKFGLYYSMLDWHHPDYTADFGKYVDQFMFGQVRELCSKYGALDCLWFDGEWDRPAADWKADALVRMIRGLQPDILVNDRLGKGERGVTPLCDFYTREQPSEMNVAMPFEKQRPYSWEACMTIGESWQYSAKDKQFKSVADLIRILVDVVDRGGNLLLNVGPTPDGEIPEPLVERLRGVGAWLATNGESIYGTHRSPFGQLPAGKCTTKGNRLYVHLEKHPGGPVQLPGLQNTIQKAWFLKSGVELAFDSKAKTVTLPDTLPDDAVTTIALELDAPPLVQ